MYKITVGQLASPLAAVSHSASLATSVTSLLGSFGKLAKQRGGGFAIVTQTSWTETT